jgi:hypothetical protein
MANYPLGNFWPQADADPKILAAAKKLVSELPTLPAGDISRAYLHWSVAGACTEFPDYNVMVVYNNGEHEMVITHSPRDNAVSTFSEDGYAAHTYHRNEGALGVCLAGMDGAYENDFGPDPVTVAGLNYLCAAAAAVAFKYGIDLGTLSSGGPTGAYTNELSILTHCEAANRPGNPPQYSPYGPEPKGDGERWDLGTLTPLPENVALTDAMAEQSGDAIRRLILTYKEALMGHED